MLSSDAVEYSVYFHFILKFNRLAQCLQKRPFTLHLHNCDDEYLIIETIDGGQLLIQFHIYSIYFPCMYINVLHD